MPELPEGFEEWRRWLYSPETVAATKRCFAEMTDDEWRDGIQAILRRLSEETR